MHHQANCRHSYSIAVFNTEGKLLVVTNRTTYEFANIVQGRQVPNEAWNYLTAEERGLLYKYDFTKMVENVFYIGGGRIKPNNIERMGKLFYNKWDRATVHQCLNDATATTGKLMDSLPGGRRNDGDESLLHTALRELYEETRIRASDIEVLSKVPIQLCHVDNDTKYVNVVWIAKLINRDVRLNINYGTQQSHEVSSIGWYSCDELYTRCPDHRRHYMELHYSALFAKYRRLTSKKHRKPYSMKHRTACTAEWRMSAAPAT